MCVAHIYNRRIRIIHTYLFNAKINIVPATLIYVVCAYAQILA